MPTAPAAAATGHAPLGGDLNGRRLLVVRFSGLGDVVLTLPAVRALPLLRPAYPGLPIMTSNLAAIQAVRRRFEAAGAPAAPGGRSGKRA